MKFLIIIPAHNEKEFILNCLQSLESQIYQNFSCVVVDDGSTDDTNKIVEKFVNQHFNFSFIQLNSESHQPGAKVVKAFYEGLQSVDYEFFDVVCKFDADIIFPVNYLEQVNQTFEENPKAGIVGGLLYIKDENGNWIFENISNKNHVRGPIKSYRKECFDDIGGLKPILGWDNIDVMLAKMHSWEVLTIKDIWVKHLRPTAQQYQAEKAKKLGQYFYNIGLSFPLAVISSAKASVKDKSISAFFVTMKSFLFSAEKKVLSEEEINFIRKLRWNEMLKKWR